MGEVRSQELLPVVGVLTLLLFSSTPAESSWPPHSCLLGHRRWQLWGVGAGVGDAGVGGKKSHEEQRRGPETAGRLQVSWLPSAPPLPATGEEATGWGGRGATAAWVQRAQSGKWGREGSESLTPSSSSQGKRISKSTTCHVLPIPFSYQSLLQFIEHLLGTCCIRHSSKALQTKPPSLQKQQ